jgi:cytoskeletal protein CcmA (bactofilin family)
MFGRRSLKRTRSSASARGDPARCWRPRHGVFTVALAVLLLPLMMATLTPGHADAAELRQGDAIVVPPDETIDDDLYAFGQTVTIQGTVHGDVIAAGQSVTISGPVVGDVMAAGGTVVVNGPITGAARLAGQSVEINAPVGDDLLAGGATVNVNSRARISRDVLVGGNTVVLGGPVGRSIRAVAERLTIGGPVGGDVLAQAGTLHLANGADIQGSLSYTSNQDAVMETGATVRGMTTRLEGQATPAPPSPAARFGEASLAWFKALIGMSVFGLALLFLFPGFTSRFAETVAAQPWASLGLGFAVLVGMPIAAVLLFVAGLLIGGWWIGPLALALYLASLPVGFTVAGLFLGRLMLQRVGRPNVASGWSLLAGLVLLGLVSLVPLVGAVALFVALLFGLGAFIQALIATYREWPGATGTRPTPEAHADNLGEPIPAQWAPLTTVGT